MYLCINHACSELEKGVKESLKGVLFIFLRQSEMLLGSFLCLRRHLVCFDWARGWLGAQIVSIRAEVICDWVPWVFKYGLLL